MFSFFSSLSFSVPVLLLFFHSSGPLATSIHRALANFQSHQSSRPVLNRFKHYLHLEKKKEEVQSIRCQIPSFQSGARVSTLSFSFEPLTERCMYLFPFLLSLRLFRKIDDEFAFDSRTTFINVHVSLAFCRSRKQLAREGKVTNHGI